MAEVTITLTDREDGLVDARWDFRETGVALGPDEDVTPAQRAAIEFLDTLEPQNFEIETEVEADDTEDDPPVAA